MAHFYSLTTNTHSSVPPAEFDLRSDSLTVPTQEMLHAAMTASFKDDITQEDPSTEALQAEMARVTGHEAALFVVSGTIGNQIALRSLLAQPPPYSVIIDSRAHILHYEAVGVSTFTGATLQPVTARNRKYMTLEDIKEKVVLSDCAYNSPTKVITIENTLNGLVMPLEELRRIAAFARQNRIKMHLDGARICDAVVAGAGTLPDYCREFDTVTICFSKGLGAPLGSILVGSREVILRARRVRQSIGGGVHQSGILAAMAHVAFKQTFGDSLDGKGSVLAKSHQNATRISDLWIKSGGKLLGPTETGMVFLDLEDARLSLTELAMMASEHGLIINRQRLVVHYQISEEAIRRIDKLFMAISARKFEKTRLRDREPSIRRMLSDPV